MRYFLGFLAVVLVGVVAIVLLVGNRPQSPQGSNKKQVDLTTYDRSDAVMRLTIDGRINSLEEHRAVRISVGRTFRQAEVLTGYEGTRERNQILRNEQKAFEVFLRALQN